SLEAGDRIDRVDVAEDDVADRQRGVGHRALEAEILAPLADHLAADERDAPEASEIERGLEKRAVVGWARIVIVASPGQRGVPAAARYRTRVADRGSGPGDADVRLERLRLIEPAVRDLRRPQRMRIDGQPDRPGIEAVEIEVVAVLVRLAAVEPGALELGPPG